jgi:hypothetical protein
MEGQGTAAVSSRSQQVPYTGCSLAALVALAAVVEVERAGK